MTKTAKTNPITPEAELYNLTPVSAAPDTTTTTKSSNTSFYVFVGVITAFILAVTLGMFNSSSQSTFTPSTVTAPTITPTPVDTPSSVAPPAPAPTVN